MSAVMQMHEAEVPAVPESVALSTLLDGPPPPPVDFVLPGLPAGQMGLLIGSDGAGKSGLALQMGLAVAARMPVAGISSLKPEATGRVVMIGGEDDRDQMHRVARRVIDAYKSTQPEIAARVDAAADRLEIVALDGHTLPLMTAGRQDAGPRETEHVQRLTEIVQGARLTIIDPLVMFHEISELDNGHMDALARCIIRITRAAGGGATLVVHHTGQDALLSARDDHQSGRGCTALASASRAVWVLRRLSTTEADQREIDESERKCWRVLRGSKISRAAEQDAVWLRAGEGGVLMRAEPPPMAGRGGGRGGKPGRENRDRAAEWAA